MGSNGKAGPSLDEILAEFRCYGLTDEAYLSHHFSRFVETKREVCRTREPRRDRGVLDVGAHWLHQSCLWARDGYQVTAVDLPSTLEMTSVQALANARSIRLIPCADLERAAELGAIPDDSVDLVLFTEILEHITFNPVRLWGEIYRVLAPGGRIVITTPNYYWIDGRVWDWRRFGRGLGGGISVDEVLKTPTYGHHWREYSMREVIKYFCLLSPDFKAAKAVYPDTYALGVTGSALSRRLQKRFPWLRQNLHLEIELAAKGSGITLVPAW